MALPPLPLSDLKQLPYSFQDWLRQLQLLVGGVVGSIPWSNVSKTGANLTDLPTRNHNDLQNIQGGAANDHYHLTAVQQARLIATNRVAATAQTGSIAATTITTPATDGEYLLTFYIVCTVSGAAGTVAPTFTWEDDAAPRTYTPSTISLNAANYRNEVLTIRAISGVPIQYSTAVAGASGSPEYDLFVNLQRLN